MVLKKKTIDAIKAIIKNHHNLLMFSVLGKGVLTKEQMTAIKRAKLNVDKYKAANSLLDLAYNHNLHNEDGDHTAPQSVKEAKNQQKEGVHEGEHHDSAKEHLNSNMESLIEKQSTEVLTRIESMVRDNNNKFRFDALQNPNRTEALEQLAKKNTVSGLKQKLRDTSKDANRNWTRIAATEISNAVGIGSIDRIIKDNEHKPAGDVYVYRVNPDDAATCKYCRKFYIDRDHSPKVYRLAALMGNGSNYGKKASEWLPTSLSTHPNCRDSQVLELRPGFKLMPGGKVEFIGLDAWREYIEKKVQS